MIFENLSVRFHRTFHNKSLFTCITLTIEAIVQSCLFANLIYVSKYSEIFNVLIEKIWQINTHKSRCKSEARFLNINIMEAPDLCKFYSEVLTKFVQRFFFVNAQTKQEWQKEIIKNLNCFLFFHYNCSSLSLYFSFYLN